MALPSDLAQQPEQALPLQSSPVQPEISIWSAPLAGGGEPVKLAEGDAPAISAQGQLAYVKDDHVWTVPLDGGKPERLFFDRGKDGDLRWSPDGSRLAFVSNRGERAPSRRPVAVSA